MNNRKFLVLMIMLVSFSIAGCSGKNDIAQEKSLESSIENQDNDISEKQKTTEENNATTIIDETQKYEDEENESEKDINEAEETVVQDNGYIFSTEYTVEGYSHGYFIVTKMNGKLYGVLDAEGNEVLPLKYDQIGFYNSDEIIDGSMEDMLFKTKYENVYSIRDCNDEISVGYRVVKPYLGESNENIAYYTRPLNALAVEKEYTDGSKDWTYKNSKIEFYNQNKEMVGEIEFENPIAAYYQLTKEYYLVVEDKDDNIIVVYLCDKENNIIWEGNGRSCIVKLIDNNVVLWIDNTTECFYSMNADGKWEEVTGYYHDETGVHKGTKDGGLQYTLGKNDDIYLKYSNNTWKLIYSDGSPVYEDRYFDMSEYYNRYFFLKNENADVCLIDNNGEIIVDYGTFSYEERGATEPDFMGSNLWYDKVFADDEALYIVRENGDLYDVYRYGHSK